MKKISLSITVLALTALALATSCQKDSSAIPFVPGDQVRFSVGSAGTGTKAVYSGAGTSTIERIDWQEGDQIRIYCAQVSEPECKYADYAVTKVSAKEAISEADIAVTEGEGLVWGEETHTFYGVYPSPEEAGSVTASISISPYNPVELKSSVSTSISGATVQANLTDGQDIIGGITKSGSAWTAAPDLKNMLMTAKSADYSPATGIPGGTVFLRFTPLTTAIQFTITNSTGAELDLTKVQLISGNGKTSAEPIISGAFSVNMDATGIAAGTVVQPFTDSDFKITYSRDYPECTAVKTSSTDQDADRTLTISVGTGTAPLAMAVGETLTCTFFLIPIHDFRDLTFKLVKADGSWMSARLGYTDGSGIFFPRHMKSTVTGLLVPEGAQWTVYYSPSVTSWDQDAVKPVSPAPEVDGGDHSVIEWETDGEGILLKPTTE